MRVLSLIFFQHIWHTTCEIGWKLSQSFSLGSRHFIVIRHIAETKQQHNRTTLETFLCSAALPETEAVKSTSQ